MEIKYQKHNISSCSLTNLSPRLDLTQFFFVWGIKTYGRLLKKILVLMAFYFSGASGTEGSLRPGDQLDNMYMV